MLCKLEMKSDRQILNANALFHISNAFWILSLKRWLKLGQQTFERYRAKISPFNFKMMRLKAKD